MKNDKSCKEIAKEIKTTIQQIKGVKVSVTSDINHINVHVMAAPFQMITNNEIVFKGQTWNNEENRKPFDGYYSVNQYRFKDNENLTTDAKILFALIEEIMKKYHWDKSDSMTDYFNCAFYYGYSVGKWDKKFEQVTK